MKRNNKITIMRKSVISVIAYLRKFFGGGGGGGVGVWGEEIYFSNKQWMQVDMLISYTII